MLKRVLIAAGGLALSAPVLADGWHQGYYRHHPRYYQPYRAVVVVRPPVYYAPAPAYYYRAPAPTYYPPLPPSGISIRLNFPL